MEVLLSNAQAVPGRGTAGVKLGIAPLGSEVKQHLEAFARQEVESVKTCCCLEFGVLLGGSRVPLGLLVGLLIFRFSARGWGTELRMTYALSVIKIDCPQSKQVSKSMQCAHSLL